MQAGRIHCCGLKVTPVVDCDCNCGFYFPLINFAKMDIPPRARCLNDNSAVV